MATKIRLARHGKKNKPFYHIVTADARAPRDGRYIERIGSYNPNTNPAIIDIDFERALHWVGVGAIPTNTVRAMLSYKGVMYKNHLLKGVKKGALTAEQVEEKFAAWLKEKENKIDAKISSIDQANEKAKNDALASEKEKNEARASVLATAQAEAIKAEEAAKAAETATEEPAAETVTEEPAAETATEEPTAAETATEEPAAAETATEEPTAETATEEPAADSEEKETKE